MGAFVWAAIVLAGCSAVPPPADPTPVLVLPAPAASANEAASPSAVAAPPKRGRRFMASSRPLVDDLDADTGPAPCDFARTYRGKIDDIPLTLLLAVPAPDRLEGLGHYDRPGPALALRGTRRGAVDFSFQEKGGGRFEGKCDDKGALRGTYTLGPRTRPFALLPRPAEWPPLHRVERTATVEPRHARCAKEGFADRPTELESEDGRIVCLPTSPKAKKALLAEGPYLLCSAHERGYRAFGLPDAAVEKGVNGILDSGWFEVARKDLKGCSGILHLSHDTGLVAVRRDLLVVSGFTSNDYGGAHPLNNGGHSTAVDLLRAATLEPSEIVDVPKLREIAVACLPFYRAATGKKEIVLDGPLPATSCDDEQGLGRILWACGKDDLLQDPVLTLLPEGIVLGQWANPHVSAALDGKGPVVPWGVLLREKALRPASPAAYLWAGVAAAPAGALTCPLAYWGDTLEEWREQP